MNLQPTSLIANNQALRAFSIDGLIHTPKPISQLVSFSISNLVIDEIFHFKLKDYVDCSLLINSLTADFKQDDDAVLQSGSNNPAQPPNTQIRVQGMKNGKVIDNYLFSAGYYFSQVMAVLDCDKDFAIKANKDLNKVTFYCEPIYLLSEVNVSASLPDPSGSIL